MVNHLAYASVGVARLMYYTIDGSTLFPPITVDLSNVMEDNASHNYISIDLYSKAIVVVTNLASQIGRMKRVICQPTFKRVMAWVFATSSRRCKEFLFKWTINEKP
jgi:hypothetical protein